MRCIMQHSKASAFSWPSGRCCIKLRKIAICNAHHILYMAMKLYPKSLRQKLAIGYIAAVIIITGFVLLSWSNLNNLEEMVHAGDIVTEFFDTTLEIRRFEKNYFLYGTAEDHEELLGYVNHAERLLGREELSLFTFPGVLDELRQNMAQYRNMLVNRPEAKKVAWENRIRSKGKAIVTIAEKISEDRKVIKRESLRMTKRHLVMSVGALLGAVFAGGFMFYRRAVKPLSTLEEHMNRISEGEFTLIPTPFSESEFVTLKAAFNRMLLELRERQRHIVQSEKLASLGTLVFGVAHELNNPLSNISTSCQILKEDIEESDMEHKRELLDQIETETDRARDVVSSLLEYSKAREKKHFQLNRTVHETLRLLRAEIPAKINVVTKIPEEIELFADKQKIQQLLLNLIKNAADAISDDGEIDISASAGPTHVQMEVRDTGEGMDKETLSKIFDPFFSSKKEKKGYGLGLFIVHNIVKEHRGKMDVDSRPGHGTMFTITLPLKES